MSSESGNVCIALYKVKDRLPKGTKAALSVEAAISAISSRLNDFGNTNWYCKGGD